MVNLSVLNCSACNKLLSEPITLSCGYTICLKCLPSKSSATGSVFSCPVPGCKQASHLFGPSVCQDDYASQFLTKEVLESPDDSTLYQSVSNSLLCKMNNTHTLRYPVTSHCGHTFCKLCLLQHRLSFDSCKLCQKRLPSYKYIQQQPVNRMINSIITMHSRVKRVNQEISKVSSNENTHIDISLIPSTGTNSTYSNVPIYLTDFPVLPSQKLRLPIYAGFGQIAFKNSLLSCSDYGCLSLAMLGKTKTKSGHFGTIVKIVSFELVNNDILIDIVGLDRFQVDEIINESDLITTANITIRLEEKEDLEMMYETIYQKKKHWTEYTTAHSRTTSSMNTPVTSPSSSPKASLSSSFMEPSYDYAQDTHAIRLANRIHNFISQLAHSTPSTSFCSAVEGLLGPVWLESVQGLHGPLPPVENPVALCWWSAIVLPVSNSDRYSILDKYSLVDRLTIVLSWINDLETQWGNCRRTAINSVTKVFPS
ncbi:hypothetical protein BDB01DRAFT_786530 [Pilobolus umbonatus]|nr:hypothetical protein BDB01DRAFT_786530 [Pilobolus umbonatus]